MNPQAPCGGYRAGPVVHGQDKNHMVPPESRVPLSELPWCRPCQGGPGVGTLQPPLFSVPPEQELPLASQTCFLCMLDSSKAATHTHLLTGWRATGGQCPPLMAPEQPVTSRLKGAAEPGLNWSGAATHKHQRRLAVS